MRVAASKPSTRTSPNRLPAGGVSVVGASTPCGVVHLGWLYSNGSSEFLALIARPAKEGEAVWSVGNPAQAALAALLVASAGRTA